jgi:hypothetical protein
MGASPCFSKQKTLYNVTSAGMRYAASAWSN